MNKKLLTRYAHLILIKGVNIQRIKTYILIFQYMPITFRNIG